MPPGSNEGTPSRPVAPTDDENDDIAVEGRASTATTGHSTEGWRGSQSSSLAQVPQRRPSRNVNVDMRASRQVQMLSSFLNEHFPTAEAKAGLANRRSYLAALPDVDFSASPLLRTAVDTLCFAHIGTKNGDQSMIRESQALYGQVLSVLVRATSQGSTAGLSIDLKTLITSIMVLCLYEDAIPLPQQGQNGWAAHYWGCQQILLIHGPTIFNMNDPFDRLIFWNLRMPLFFLGIARRASIALGQLNWLELAEASPESKGPLTEFYRAGMKVPALLERMDTALSDNVGPEVMIALGNEINAVNIGLIDWFASKISTQSGALIENPESVHLSDSAAFDMEIEEHRFMVSSTVFETVLRYRTSALVAKSHTLFLLCHLILECTILRLLHFRPFTADCFGPRTIQDIERNAYDIASDLCRSIYHYSYSISLAEADFTEFLATVGQEFFEEIGAADRVSWCQAIRRATQLRVQRLKQNGRPRTLCRIADVAPGFARNLRYKTWDLARVQPV